MNATQVALAPLAPLLRLTLLAALGCPAALFAAEGAGTTSPTVSASLAWSRATTASAQTAVAYLTIANHGDHDVQLTAATSSICDHIEIHESSCCANGEMAMHAIPMLVVPAHGTLVLKPDGNHLMLIKLAHGLSRGEEIPLTLTVGAAVVPVVASVRSASAMAPTD